MADVGLDELADRGVRVQLVGRFQLFAGYPDNIQLEVFGGALDPNIASGRAAG